MFWYILLGVMIPLAGALGWFLRWIYARFQLSSAEQIADRIKEDAVREAEAKKKEIVLEAKDELIKERNQLEREFRERRAELQRQERRIIQKEDNLDNKLSLIEEKEQGFAQREAGLEETEKRLEEEIVKWRHELEKVSALSMDEAKALIIREMEEEAKRDAQGVINKIEAEAERTAEKKARDIVVTTIQRLATEISSEVTVTSVSLPSDEMKGRIIGREGRNIRTLETLTGVDIIIDDTPEAVIISCFDPVRKEVAKVSLERLISDGRIHPARIEEIVTKVSKEIGHKILEEGEKVLFDLGIHNMSPDMTRALGRLYYRTSYGQNVLMHSKECAIIASMLAAELGTDRVMARRAALLHDIGKGIETDSDSNHAEMGMELARKHGEAAAVINAIGSHHNDIEVECIEAVFTQIADAISAARPGARRESIDNYIKRLENLEKIATDFKGVEKAFAIQAGRELRIMVNAESVDDNGAKELAKAVAKQIENELRYPGRIKVTMIRETRIVEYAR